MMELATEFFTLFSSRVTSVQSSPDTGVLLVAALLALVLSSPPLWHWTRNLITMVHEAGHALMGLLWGRRLSGIKLHTDTSGVTVSRGKPHGLGMVFTLLAGYTAPALIAAILAVPLAQGRITATLTILAVLSMAMFLMIRNFWGWIVVGVAIVSLHFFITYSPVPAQSFILALLVAFLAIGSFRPIVELQAHRMNGKGEGSDADQLRALTLIPGTAWVAIFFLIEVVAFVWTFDHLFLR